MLMIYHNAAISSFIYIYTIISMANSIFFLEKYIIKTFYTIESIKKKIRNIACIKCSVLLNYDTCIYI